MAYDGDLANRIREALADEPFTREVKMFGGLAFMVNGKLAIGAYNSDGGLLLHGDPEHLDDLLVKKGAKLAEMGAGRQMGNGWIAVDAQTITTKKDLDYWIGIALEYNKKITKKQPRKENN